jgi:hypothetical protein
VRNRLGSLVDAVEALIEALERSSLEYAFGGAIALSAWAEPRATTDIDLNLWIDDDGLVPALRALDPAGVTVDLNSARSQIDSRGMFVGRIQGYRLDVFVPSVPFYTEALTRRKRLRILDRETWVLSAECLAVFKLLFFRAKDLVDLERLVAVQGSELDRSFIRQNVASMMGDTDDRIRAWDELVSRH